MVIHLDILGHPVFILKIGAVPLSGDQDGARGQRERMTCCIQNACGSIIPASTAEQAATGRCHILRGRYHSWLPAVPEFRAQRQLGGDAFSRTESLLPAGLSLLASSSRDLGSPHEVGIGSLTEAVTSNSVLLQRDERSG